MPDIQKPSKAARIIASFFKPKEEPAIVEQPSTDEPEDREKPNKSFAANMTASIMNRLRNKKASQNSRSEQ